MLPRVPKEEVKTYLLFAVSNLQWVWSPSNCTPSHFVQTAKFLPRGRHCSRLFPERGFQHSRHITLIFFRLLTNGALSKHFFNTENIRKWSKAEALYYWSNGAAGTIPFRGMAAGLSSRFSVLCCAAQMQILWRVDSPCKQSYHVSKYRVAEKSVNLKHPLVLMGVFRFKPASQYVQQYHSVVSCALNMEDHRNNIRKFSKE
jgi:hypothetical protein